MSRFLAVATALGHGIVTGATALAVWAGPLAAQAAGGGSLRPYTHVFIAYAAAWILVVAWLIHIARRLRRVTENGG